MIKTYRTNVDTCIEAKAVMRLENPDLTMDEAIAKLEALGNQIIERDDENRSVTVLDTKQFMTEVVYECEKGCGAYSRHEQKIIDHEKECQHGSDSC